MNAEDQELMFEILDALRWPGYDCDHQGRHAELLGEFLLRPGLKAWKPNQLQQA